MMDTQTVCIDSVIPHQTEERSLTPPPIVPMTLGDPMCSTKKNYTESMEQAISPMTTQVESPMLTITPTCMPLYGLWTIELEMAVASMTMASTTMETLSTMIDGDIWPSPQNGKIALIALMAPIQTTDIMLLTTLTRMITPTILSTHMDGPFQR